MTCLGKSRMFPCDMEATPDSSPHLTAPSTPNSVTSKLLLLEFWLLVDEMEIRFGSGLLNSLWMSTQVSVPDLASWFWEFLWIWVFISTTPDRHFGLFIYDIACLSSAESSSLHSLFIVNSIPHLTYIIIIKLVCRLFVLYMCNWHAHGFCDVF